MIAFSRGFPLDFRPMTGAMCHPSTAKINALQRITDYPPERLHYTKFSALLSNRVSRKGERDLRDERDIKDRRDKSAAIPTELAARGDAIQDMGCENLRSLSHAKYAKCAK